MMSEIIVSGLLDIISLLPFVLCISIIFYFFGRFLKF